MSGMSCYYCGAPVVYSMCIVKECRCYNPDVSDDTPIVTVRKEKKPYPHPVKVEQYSTSLYACKQGDKKDIMETAAKIIQQQRLFGGNFPGAHVIIKGEQFDLNEGASFEKTRVFICTIYKQALDAKLVVGRLTLDPSTTIPQGDVLDLIRKRYCENDISLHDVFYTVELNDKTTAIILTEGMKFVEIEAVVTASFLN